MVNRWMRADQVPASTPAADRLSKDLRQRGFTFVGPTICYAYMQAVGLVCDHLAGCFRHPLASARSVRHVLSIRHDSSWRQLDHVATLRQARYRTGGA